jgi:hypothetical protein
MLHQHELVLFEVNALKISVVAEWLCFIAENRICYNQLTLLLIVIYYAK